MMRRSAILAAVLLMPLPALAHPGHGEASGFLAGLMHPLSGADHLLAMATLGLWAGLLGGAARWALPGGVLTAMVAGGVLGAAGIALPGVEAGILASVILLGALAALALRLPLAAGVALAALFGLLHGHAHGVEMTAGAPLAYGAGFLLATAALHGLGLFAASTATQKLARIAGGGAVAAGLAMALFG